MPAPSRPRAARRREPVELTRAEARAFLVGHHALGAPELPPGAEGVRALLERLRCIQLDPLDPLGTNADLVALARVDGIAKGDVYRHLLPGQAFEHFAKERCLLPASAFPWYRAHAAVEAPWWSHEERLRRLPEGVVERVLAELRARGPLSAGELADHGRVEPLDWSGWKGTPRAAKMALEVLQTRCDVVVCGRGPRGKLYDVPERALPEVARLPNPLLRRGGGPRTVGSSATAGARGQHAPNSKAAKPAAASGASTSAEGSAAGHPSSSAGRGGAQPGFDRWAIRERVEAAGFLARGGAASVWSTLHSARRAGVADALLAEGAVEEVRVEGSRRTYLAPLGFAGRHHPEPDDRVRLLGPLDPLLWDRDLVRTAFGFDYTWEVYRPLHLRRFAWYVCPLLRGGALVGRLDGAVRDGALRIAAVWAEPGGALDRASLLACLERHAEACGVRRVVLPRSFRVNRA